MKSGCKRNHPKSSEGRLAKGKISLWQQIRPTQTFKRKTNSQIESLGDEKVYHTRFSNSSNEKMETME